MLTRQFGEIRSATKLLGQAFPFFCRTLPNFRGRRRIYPEQNQRYSLLFGVDPSSPSEVWQSAAEEGKSLTKQLSGGADFAELAREHSSDASADEGGDMGYLHSGMLSPAAQEQVDKLKPGELSDPVVLMEGVAIFRLDDRIPPKLNNFDSIKDRARALWLTEQSDIAWKSLLVRLKKNTPVRVNELRYLPLASPAETPAAEQLTENPADIKQ